ncbi:hypothetical protein V1525DRAFT_390460 [Lipomyces kononenkoae]|uniref:Uncharacterized protein n=1 Tax=Lipomyces kononenkoae TaxID=34357 RepID=A0ACC3SWA5_LIPKO
MSRRSKKSIQRSINGRKNALKRYDMARRAALRIAEASDGQDTEELRVVEVCLTQSEIDNALKRLSFVPEADKSLQYTTGLGDLSGRYEDSKRSFGIEVSAANLRDENLTQKNQEDERRPAAEGEIDHNMKVHG